MLWLTFAASSLFVVIAGLMIGRLSGEIGERLNLRRAWAGAVLISFATTLPELVTTVTLCMRGSAGIALGGIIGSITFNLFILVIVDLLDRDTIYHRVSMNHLVTGLLGCVLLAVLSSSLSLELAGFKTFQIPIIRNIGWMSLIILCLYALGQYLLVKVAGESKSINEPMKEDTIFNKFSNKSLLVIYVGIALVIFIAANQLGIAVEGIASRYGLGATFAGAALLGVVTSLPEITNAIACVKQKEFDLAVGNILGANALVIAVFAIADFFDGHGVLLSMLTRSDILTSLVMAGLGIVMQGIALTAIAAKSSHRISRLGIASLALASLYLFGLYVSYQFHG